MGKLFVYKTLLVCNKRIFWIKINFSLKIMEYIREIVEKEKIEFIDVLYTDLSGILRKVSFPVGYLDKFIKNGIGIDGSSVPGFKDVAESDMRLIMDERKFFIDPLSERKRLCIIGSLFLGREEKRFENSPRYVLIKAIDYMRKRGICDNAYFLPEIEFYIFDKVEYKSEILESFYRIESRENFYHRGYHIAPPFDKFDDFRERACYYIEKAGIKVKYHHHEVGRFCQGEIEIDFSDALDTADNIVIVKYLLKRLAEKEGIFITFMPKPLYNEPGNGLHLHQFLEKEGRSIFSDPSDYMGLSKEGKYYIGGILKHAPSLCALTNPSTNSYKRLISGFEAPRKISYSVANRTTMIRIPGYISKKEMRIEIRSPDATFNPYLAIAAILMAGIDGIENGIPCGEPVSQDLEREESLKIPSLPSSLEDALRELERDNLYLKKGNVFPDSLISKWIEIKRMEFEEVEKRPHPYEFLIYF